MAWTRHPALKTQGSPSPGRAPEAWQEGPWGRGTHKARVDAWLWAPAGTPRLESHLNEERRGDHGHYGEQDEGAAKVKDGAFTRAHKCLFPVHSGPNKPKGRLEQKVVQDRS